MDKIKSKSILIRLIILVSMTMVLPALSAQTTWYVDDDAPCGQRADC